MRLLLICNTAPHYRSAIFQMMDRELGCDFVFGDKVLDIKKMDYSTLTHKVTEVHNLKLKSCYYQKGVLRFLHSAYDKYIITGDSRCLSTWLFLVLLLFLPKKKVYLWSHGWLKKKKGIDKLISRMFFGLADGVFIYNNRSRLLMTEGGIKARKLFTVYNSLDYDTQLAIRNDLHDSNVYLDHFGNDNKTIIFIGRLTTVKRLDLLLEAVASLKKQGHYYNIVLVGDGESRSLLEQKTSELVLQNNVWFFGASYDEKTNAELLYNADLCVSPGNIGLTAMHSMMFGCPCITNNDFDHQMPEFEAVQEGVTGAFFEANDVASLATSIGSWFVKHAEDRKNVRYNCYNVIDTTWNLHNQIGIIGDALNKSI